MKREVINLNPKEFEKILELLKKPPKISKALKKLLKNINGDLQNETLS